MVQISHGKRAGSHPRPLGMTNESELSEGWHESPGDSSDDPKYAYYWARGTRLYFFDPEVWQHYYQGGALGTVSVWQRCEGIMVTARSECTHLVINYTEQDVADRDGRAGEDMHWAATNGVGKLQHHISW